MAATVETTGLWDAVGALADRAPSVADLRFHGLQLVAARRMKAQGRPVPMELLVEQRLTAIRNLHARDVLQRALDVLDGELLLIKGPEAAARWADPLVRPSWDLDLLVPDSAAAQRALLAAGFHEISDPALYRDIHHLRPLQWGDAPLGLELHHAPKWPDGLAAPPAGELLGRAQPSATGVAGLRTLDPAAHALVLAAHSWAHAPLATLRHLIDVVVVAAEAEPGEIAELADRWHCRRMWETTAAAAAAALLDGPPTPATRIWARHLAAARERTVFEHHLREITGPLWGLPNGVRRRRTLEAVGRQLRREGDESWARKLRRARGALTNAGVAKSVHDETAQDAVPPMGDRR